MDYLLAHDGTRYPLTQWPVTIGRQPTNTIALSDDSVSGYHARLEQQGLNVILADLNSTNGCWVNGSRVFTAQKLANGDQLRIGNVLFTFGQENVASGVCPYCQGAVRPGAKFCPSCGQGLFRPVAPVPVPAHNPPPPPAYNPPPLAYNSQPQIYDPFPLVNNPHSAGYNSLFPAGAAFKPNQRERISLGEALRFASSDSSWISKMILGGLVSMIPVLGYFLVQGYLIEVIRRVVNNDSEKLPQWDNWGQKFGDGLAYIFLAIILVGSFVFPLALPGFLFLLMGEELGLWVSYLGAALGGTIGGFFLPVGLGRYATTGRVTSALQFGAMWAQISPHFGRYVGNLLLRGIFLWLGFLWLIFLASLISVTVLLAIPVIIGLPLYLYVFYIHLMAQMYQIVE